MLCTRDFFMPESASGVRTWKLTAKRLLFCTYFQKSFIDIQYSNFSYSSLFRLLSILVCFFAVFCNVTSVAFINLFLYCHRFSLLCKLIKLTYAVLLVVPRLDFPQKCILKSLGTLYSYKIYYTFRVFSPCRSQISKYGLFNRGFCSISCFVIVWLNPSRFVIHSEPSLHKASNSF